MDARIEERTDGFVVIDEYGDEWNVFTDDGCGRWAIERDTPERWEAGTYCGGVIALAQEGATFGVNCQDEFIVRRVDQAGSLRWEENTFPV
jgi:hypothetical protein